MRWLPHTYNVKTALSIGMIETVIAKLHQLYINFSETYQAMQSQLYPGSCIFQIYKSCECISQYSFHFPLLFIKPTSVTIL